MKIDYYTNGIDIISIIKKQGALYLVKDTQSHILILSNLNGYRLVGDNRSIKDWYQDSKIYLKEHPLAAFLAGLGIFIEFTTI
ncbi:MAG TPA: hypothetical protein EYO73_03410 [Sulfurimonas sp.]|nr:hypothetical protein [Sulfurimonas sp.]